MHSATCSIWSREMKQKVSDETGAIQLGLTPDFIRIEFAAMVPGLAGKRRDMIDTGIFLTEERSKLMYMVPCELAAIGFLVARGNPI